MILADYHGYFKPRVLRDHFFSLNSCKKISARHVASMADRMVIVKRSVRIAGHATSVSLEPAFWDALCEIAARREMSLNALLSRIDAERGSLIENEASRRVRKRKTAEGVFHRDLVGRDRAEKNHVPRVREQSNGLGG